MIRTVLFGFFAAMRRLSSTTLRMGGVEIEQVWTQELGSAAKASGIEIEQVWSQTLPSSAHIGGIEIEQVWIEAS